MKLILTSILLWVSLCETNADEPPEWLTFPAGTEFTLTEHDGVSSARIPVRFGKSRKPSQKLRAVIRDVTFDGKRPESLAKKLKLSVDDEDQAVAQRGPSLVLIADQALTKPGVYRILAEVSPGPSTDDQMATQSFSLTLTQEEASVRVSPLLLVEQEYGFWHTTTRSSRLIVSETSGATSLTDVSVCDVRDPTGAQPIDDGELHVHVPLNRVTAGSSETAVVKVNGNFPLQLTAGSLELRADQLKKPITVNYQVRARRTPAWIWVLSLAGFLVGWIIRVFLKERREFLEARQEASGAVDEIRQAMVKIPDSVVQMRLTEIREVLQTAAIRPVPSDIHEAVIVARNGLKSVLDDFSERRAQVVAQAIPLAEILRRSWILPRFLMDLLEQLRSELRQLTNALEANSVSEAQKQLNALQTGAMLELFNGLNRWRREAGSYLEEVAANPIPQTEKGTEFLQSAITAWRAAFPSVHRTAALAEKTQLLDALEVTHAAMAAAMDLLNHCERDVVKLTAWIDEKLHSPLRPVMAETQKEFNELNVLAVKVMLTDLEQPEKATLELAGRQKRLRDEWTRFLRQLLPSSVDMQSIKEAMENSQWCAAVQKAAEILQSARGGRSLPMEEMTAASLGTASQAVVLRTVIADLGERVSLNLAGVPRLDGSPAEQAYLARGARLASAVQTLFIAVLFIVVASVLSSSQWIGTAPEMLGVFAWAFGVDITSDAVLNLLKTVAPQKLTGR